MKLSRDQLQYAQSRIAKHFDALKQAELAKLGSCDDPEKLSFEDKYRQIASGKAKLKPIDRLSRYHGIDGDAFEYVVDKKAVDAFKKKQAEGQKIYAKYDALTTAALDRLMLAKDAEDALALVREIDAVK